MTKEILWLDSHTEALHELSNIAFALEHTANAFAVTGNTSIAKRLSHISVDLFNLQRQFRHAMSDCINEGYKQSQQASKNMFQAALAGAFTTKGGLKS